MVKTVPSPSLPVAVTAPLVLTCMVAQPVPKGRPSEGGSIVTTVWDRREALHQSRMADLTTQFNPAFNQALAGLHHLGFSSLSAMASISRVMTGQAYLLAADDIFWISGWISFALIGTVWLCRRAKSGGGPPPAAD